jgi:uncharacterized protein (DUF433 family)
MRNSAELDKARALVVEDPEILSGTPVIRNTRIRVYDVAASLGYRAYLQHANARANAPSFQVFTLTIP